MSSLVDSLEDVFALFGAITTKKMFGGYGIYHNGIMFALVADDVLYLKTDTETAKAFTDLGCEPFIYDKSGKKITMSYCMAPDEIFDDPEQARSWASIAYDVAQKAKKPKRKFSKKMQKS